MSAAKSPSGHPDPVASPKTGNLPCRLEHNIEKPVALERAWWPGQAAGQHHGEASGVKRMSPGKGRLSQAAGPPARGSQSSGSPPPRLPSQIPMANGQWPRGAQVNGIISAPCFLFGTPLKNALLAVCGHRGIMVRISARSPLNPLEIRSYGQTDH
jgi:hypothetical protein